ncbi:hypothetical protein C2S52_022132 [Perilla frutescens var. hirtella]|nr:hypothetical protein C2S52_022132 [Perilla frutescens var. hirtella]
MFDCRVLYGECMRMRWFHFWTMNAMILLSLSYNFVVPKPTKSGTFWVFGTIISIEAMGAWAYLSCDTCGSKVHGVENNFTCQKCNLDEVSRHLRFKFAVLVEDNTGHLNLLLWNKECLQLLGKTASEISQTREADLNEIPPEIENLVDRTALFKIQVKDEQLNKGPYTVLSLTCDEGVISNFPGFKELNEKVLSSDATTPTISKGKSKVITLDDLTEDDYLKRTGDAEISSAALLKKPKLTIKEEKQE